MKNILVSGGCGFIGSNLCSILLKQGNFVLCLDNLYTGKEQNIKTCLDNPNFLFIKHDIIEPFHYENPIDEIYHLACPASPPKYQKDPIFTLKTNFMGTLNMLEFAKKKNAKILYTSTSEIYGEPTESPQNEDYRGNVNTVGIRSCYDEGKRIGETLLMDYHNHYGIDIRIARIFNTYGPNMDPFDGRVVTNFLLQAITNTDITIYGDGTQTRSFCFIDDQINGLLKLMNSDYHQPVNIGNDHDFTIKEIAKLVLKITNSNSKIVFKHLPLDDPTNRKPDITRAKNILDWEPSVQIEEGIIKTLNYFKTLDIF